MPWLPLQGLVEAVGLSNYGPKQLAKIGAYLDKRGVPLAAVQVQYSLLRWGAPVVDGVRRCAAYSASILLLCGAADTAGETSPLLFVFRATVLPRCAAAAGRTKRRSRLPATTWAPP